MLPSRLTSGVLTMAMTVFSKHEVAGAGGWDKNWNSELQE